MRTVKAERRLEHGLARSRSAAGREAGQQGRAQADPTTYYNSCTNKPRQWSRTRRHLTGLLETRTFFRLSGAYTPTLFPNEFHEGSLTFLGQTDRFVRV